MAYNENLTNRVREALADVPNVEEKKMFRGITFMVDGKMCISVGDNRLMVRIAPELHDEMTGKNGCQTVLMGGRAYKGYIYVNEDAVKTKNDLGFWVKLALDFNPRAKATARKKK